MVICVDPPKQPRQKINVGSLVLQPNAFTTDYNPVLNQIINMKTIEPAACERLRRGLQQIERQFDLRMFKEYKFTSIMLVGSRMLTTDITKELTSLTTAYQTATSKIIELKKKYLTDINTKCASLDASTVLDDAAKSIENVAVKQRDVANQIVALPKEFEDELQSKYVQVEDFINAP